MKHVYFYISLLFFKIIDAFKPFITKYISEKTTQRIIKSLSGLLQRIPYINNRVLGNPISVIEMDKSDCDMNSQSCKIKMIVPGYMEHDPKAEAEKKYIK
uniref:Uncharacterized protein n=1 Tax=viral metagenome TaxID=1070528 RepID=A0A6C0AR81_9ZZZZ